MNKITIELCAEDRARLDRLTEALEKRTCDKCVTTAMEYVKNATEAKSEPTVAEEPTIKEEETAPPGEETPAVTEPTRKVDRAELRAKVIELSAKGLKEQTKDIVRVYAPTVSSVPEEKLTECFEKLVALEG